VLRVKVQWIGQKFSGYGKDAVDRVKVQWIGLRYSG